MTVHLWVGTCPHTRKRQYGTRRAARKIAKRAHPGRHMQAYRCEQCGYWHLGYPRAACERGMR